jgi:hypothetical protein
MNRDTATACWYRRLDPACFTDQSSSSLYAYSGELAAPAYEDRASLWTSQPAIAATWGDTAPIAEPTPHPIVSVLTDWLASLAGLWRRPLSSPR